MRRRQTNKKIIIVLTLIVCLMTAGYAAFQTKLDIKGSTEISSEWNIRIISADVKEEHGTAENVKNTYNDLTANLEANLYSKGDYVEYNVIVENKGTFDAKLDTLGITNSNNEAVKITTTGLTKGQTLYKGQTATLTVRIAYNENYEGDASGTSGETDVDLGFVQNEGGTITPTVDHLVTYDYTTNGGESTTAENEYVAEGASINLSYTAKKKNYEFVGWNTNPQASEGLTELTMGKEDITLYAIFMQLDKTPPVIKSINTTSTTNSITAVVTAVDDESKIVKYEFSIDGGKWIDNGNNNTYTFNGLKQGTSYEIKVRVTNECDLTAEKVIEKGLNITESTVTEGNGLYKDEYENGRYVYKGSNPDNYLEFDNGEIWRIIAREADGTYKIVKNDLLPEQPWDQYGLDNWGRPSDLNVYLNNTYYNELDQSIKKNIVSHDFAISGINANNNDLVAQIKDENSLIWNGNIGLISASDYIRANSNSSQCGTYSLQNVNSQVCEESNWLLAIPNRYWTITPNGVGVGGATVIIVNGYSLSNNWGVWEVDTKVRPATYLSSDITLMGKGTQSNPYKISPTNGVSTKSIGSPKFSEDKAFPRTVTITYPEGCGKEYTCSYIKDDSSEVKVTSKTAQVSFNSSGNLIAKVSDGTNTVSSTHTVVIDNDGPVVTFDPNSQSDYKNGGTKVTITISDSQTGIAGGQQVYYAWSTSSTTAPTFSRYYYPKKYTDGDKKVEVISPESDTSELTGTYYLWVKSGIRDVHGNRSADTVSGAFKFDNTAPTLNSITATAAGTDIKVTATASDKGSGVDKYYFSKDGGKTYVDSPTSNYTFTNLAPGNYLITVYVEDKAENRSELKSKTSAIAASDFCENNGIKNFGDCLIATEANEANVTKAKQIIKDKGQVDVTKTSPDVFYDKVKSSSTFTWESTKPTIYIGKSFKFDENGTYTLDEYAVLDPEDIDFTEYKYVSSNFNIETSNYLSSTSIYELTGVTVEENTTSGAKTYTFTGYKWSITPRGYTIDDVGMYADKDNQGDTYFYRGSVSNNYVEFAGKYWRVVRINGDGSVRLIYDGTKPHENDASSSDRMVGTKAFNTYTYDNTYAGYMYGDPDKFGQTIQREEYLYTKSNIQPGTKYWFGTDIKRSGRKYKLAGDTTFKTFDSNKVGYYTCFADGADEEGNSCSVIALIKEYKSDTTAVVKYTGYGSVNQANAIENVTDSTMKTYLEDWYADNLTAQNGIISPSATFCNSRAVYKNLTSSNYNNLGYGLNPTSYSGGKFLNDKGLEEYGSTYACDKNDSFSTDTKYGNGKLEYPIGLISADEASKAGIARTANHLNYLYTGNAYWTMTPSSLSTAAYITQIQISADGVFGNYQSSNTKRGARPVINLLPTVKNFSFSGNGTIDDPYKIEVN